ncbi:MAG: hypothetical protein ABI895_13565 [Deltaproteobacteria bacterium]
MVTKRILWSLLTLLVGALSGCSGCASYRRCSSPPEARIGELPARLSQTGLFREGSVDTLGPALRAYAPQYALWSDGATKRRWLSLPEGSRIDTSDMDDWLFPVGTKFWKEFSLRGRRVETRLLVKVGPRAVDWAGAAYVWDADQRDARLMAQGRKDVDGSGYNVPSAAECAACHGGRRSHVLGFSALQLSASELPLSLSALTREELITRAPARSPILPGDEREQAALGYLHANCGHCHNSARPPRGDGPRCYDPERSIDLWLPSTARATNTMSALADDLWPSALRTTVPRYVTPGAPQDSRLLTLVARRGLRLHMPPLGSRRVDPDGVRLLTEWIASLPPPNAQRDRGSTRAASSDARSTP